MIQCITWFRTGACVLWCFKFDVLYSIICDWVRRRLLLCFFISRFLLFLCSNLVLKIPGPLEIRPKLSLKSTYYNLKFLILMKLRWSEDVGVWGDITEWWEAHRCHQSNQCEDSIHFTSVECAICFQWILLLLLWLYQKRIWTSLFIFWQENVKYLPGIKLGQNVVADPDLENAGISFVHLFITVSIRKFTRSTVEKSSLIWL